MSKLVPSEEAVLKQINSVFDTVDKYMKAGQITNLAMVSTIITSGLIDLVAALVYPDDIDKATALVKKVDQIAEDHTEKY